MGTPDDDTFKQLLVAIKEMSTHLEAATSAINNMNMQLNSIGATVTVATKLPRSDCHSPINPDISDATPNGKQPCKFRNLGYINWDKSHDILKTQSLVKMSVVRQSLKNFTVGYTTKENRPAKINRAIEYSNSNTVYTEVTNYNGFFDYTKSIKPKVDKEMRFPQVSILLHNT